jgi:hypothetical protein
MSCSLYRLQRKKDAYYVFETELSDPCLSISHTEPEILGLLNITSQLGDGDKLIILYKKDIIKAFYFAKAMYEANAWNYALHNTNLQPMLDNMGDKEYDFYYIDAV